MFLFLRLQWVDALQQQLLGFVASLPRVCQGDRRILDATPSGHLTYLVTEWGKPFTAPGFGNKFRDWCNEAGLPDCSAHGIGKHAAVTAAENGATEHQLMAMFAWDSPKQAAVYTRKANRTKLAKGAMHLLVSGNENKKV